MSKIRDFSNQINEEANERQKGKCAFSGVPLNTSWSEGDIIGHAHHLKPLVHGGSDDIDNCVYLFASHHKLICHSMAILGIDKQGGNSDTWVQMEREDFMFWYPK